MTGLLLLVATPIGNLGDMSFRGVEALRTADVIACEDTRHTRKLLNHFDIHDVPVLSLHEHNERERIAEVVDRIRNGETVALVTDAGMPAISDPGELIVAGVAAAGLDVSVIPGASAVPAALAVSGLPSERFCFEGFMPRKGNERKIALTALANETRTTVLYESPKRVASTVVDLMDVCGGSRRVVLVRELTKLHEEVWRGDLQALHSHLAEDPKGECVLVLAGASVAIEHVDDSVIVASLTEAIQQGATKKDAVTLVAERLNVPKNRVYEVSIRA